MLERVWLTPVDVSARDFKSRFCVDRGCCVAFFFRDVRTTLRAADLDYSVSITNVLSVYIC